MYSVLTQKVIPTPTFYQARDKNETKTHLTPIPKGEESEITLKSGRGWQEEEKGCEDSKDYPQAKTALSRSTQIRPYTGRDW